MEAAQLGDHLLGQPVAQVFLVRVAAEVGERKDGQFYGPGRPGLERFDTFGHGLEVLRELLHGRVAGGRLLGQGLEDDLLQSGGRVGLGFLQRRRLPVEDGVDHGLVVVALERELTGEHFVEDDPERPDVGPAVDLISPGLLRRHVGDRPERRPAPRQRQTAPELGQTEVHDLGPALRGDHDVGALDVPVHDTFLMGHLQTLGNL